MKKILKPVKKMFRWKEASVDINNWILTDVYFATDTDHNTYYNSCAIDTDHNTHYVYIKTGKLLNQHFHITLEMVCNICMYHLHSTLTAQ